MAVSKQWYKSFSSSLLQIADLRQNDLIPESSVWRWQRPSSIVSLSIVDEGRYGFEDIPVFLRLVTRHYRSDDIFLWMVPCGITAMELRRYIMRTFRGPFFRRNFPRCHVELYEDGLNLNRRPWLTLIPDTKIVLVFYPRKPQLDGFFEVLGRNRQYLPMLLKRFRLFPPHS